MPHAPMRALLVGLLLVTAAEAQTVVQGRVSDAETGEGLPAATVQVLGTSRGTITNRAGDYEIAVPAGSADTLVVRFIGYQPAFGVPQGGRLDLALVPSVAELGEAVVTASVTADEIIQRVIDRKAEWQSGLRTWRAQAYSRQTIRADGQVVGVIEGQTTAYWDRDRGLREVVTGKRTTGNLDAIPANAFSAADQVVNFYDDEIEFGGFDLMGPTHPRSTRFYRWAIEGTRAIDGQRVYDLSFQPRNPLQPGFEGTLAVQTGEDALLSVSARPSASVQFPLVNQFELTLEQQFSPFGLSVAGRSVWLPADFRMSGEGKLGNALLRFPDLGFAVSSRFTDYAVNVAVPDSLYDSDETAVDSVALARGLEPAGAVPLVAEEERALAEIDSTQSLADALRPTGPLARFFSVSTSADAPRQSGPARRGLRFGGLDPILVYNRAEGLRVGGDVSAIVGAVSVGGDLAYLTAAERFSAHGSLAVRVGSQARVGVGVRRETFEIGGSDYVEGALNSLPALVNGDDYFDYARREGVRGWAEWRGGGPLQPLVSLGASLDDYDPARVETRYTLTERPLPADIAQADARDIGAATVGLRLGSLPDGLAGGVTGFRGVAVRAELGTLLAESRRVGDSDPDNEGYRRVEAEARWFVPTILRRRLLAPTLHVRLAAGAASASLPVQRAFGIDGRHAGLAPFGALRSRTGRLTLAQRYAMVAWEHDFRSVLFEALGWRGSAPRGVSLQVHGAHAWADGAPGAPRTEGSVVHHEVGASLGLGYTLPVRLDVTYRLTDDPGVVFGIGLARLF